MHITHNLLSWRDPNEVIAPNLSNWLQRDAIGRWIALLRTGPSATDAWTINQGPAGYNAVTIPGKLYDNRTLDPVLLEARDALLSMTERWSESIAHIIEGGEDALDINVHLHDGDELPPLLYVTPDAYARAHADLPRGIYKGTEAL